MGGISEIAGTDLLTEVTEDLTSVPTFIRYQVESFADLSLYGPIMLRAGVPSPPGSSSASVNMAAAMFPALKIQNSAHCTHMEIFLKF